MSKEMEIWKYLVDYDLATESELELVTDVSGYSVETLKRVIYSRTGFNSLEQLKEEEDTF